MGSNVQLPILDDAAAAQNRKRIMPWTSRLVHFFRVFVFVAIVALVHLNHQKDSASNGNREFGPQLATSDVQGLFPKMDSVSNWNSSGVAVVNNHQKQAIGFVVHTIKESQTIVGYVGATELAIFFEEDPQGNKLIIGVSVIASEDTVEHVEAVVKHPKFLRSWNGQLWSDAATADVDAVSGATLTSFAITESIRRRLGSDAPSFKFPNRVTLDELKVYYPTISRFEANTTKPLMYDVFGTAPNDNSNSTEARIGRFIRSSPTTDHVNGYQGPTDFLVLLDANDRFQKLVIRSSFDNFQPEPFVDYVKDDEYFTVDFFSEMDPLAISNIDDEEYEGVSGATMTSIGVFNSVRLLTQKSLEEIPKTKVAARRHSWLTVRDIGTVSVLCAALLLTFTQLSKLKRCRFLFQVLLVIYFGFINGDLISQVLLVGWSQNGVPITKAFGPCLPNNRGVLHTAVHQKKYLLPSNLPVRCSSANHAETYEAEIEIATPG